MLAGDVDTGKGYTRAGAGGIWEICILPAQFCCELKTSLKNKIYLKKITVSQLHN